MNHELKKGIISIEGKKIAPLTFGSEVILKSGSSLQDAIDNGEIGSGSSGGSTIVPSSSDFLPVEDGTVIFTIDDYTVKYTSGILLCRGMHYTINSGSITFTASDWNKGHPNYHYAFVFNTNDNTFYLRKGITSQPALSEGDYIIFLYYYHNAKGIIKSIGYPTKNFTMVLNPYEKYINRLTVIGDSLSVSNRWLQYVTTDNKIKIGSVNLQAIAGATMTGQGSGYASTVNAGDVVVIFQGTNDCLQEKPIGTMDDGISVNSVYGVLKNMVNIIYAKDPSIKILVVYGSPLYGYRATTEKPQKYIADVKQYSAAIKEVCDLYNLPSIDLLTSIGINELNYSTMQIDGCHYSNEGYKRLGNLIFEKLYTIL